MPDAVNPAIVDTVVGTNFKSLAEFQAQMANSLLESHMRYKNSSAQMQSLLDTKCQQLLLELDPLEARSQKAILEAATGS